jgi:hypothetical protein
MRCGDRGFRPSQGALSQVRREMAMLEKEMT